MKKRQRKKLRVGEYKELGFKIRFDAIQQTGDKWEMFDKMYDLVESMSLTCMYGSLEQGNTYCFLIELGPVADLQGCADRKATIEHAVVEFAEKNTVHSTEAIDLWYDFAEESEDFVPVQGG